MKSFEKLMSGIGFIVLIVLSVAVLFAGCVVVKHEIKIEVKHEDYGVATGSGRYRQGDEVTVKAEPEKGYLFKAWLVGDAEVSTDMVYKFLAEEDIILTAEFRKLLPDKNLEAAIMAELDIKDDVVNMADLEQLTRINVRLVEDLSGMEYAVNLEEAIFEGSPIFDISSLSGLENLKVLNLGGTDIEDISPVATLVSLEELVLARCRGIDISVLSGLNNLKNLDISQAGIKDINPLTSLDSLTRLNLFGNKVTDITALSELKSLEYLNLGNSHQGLFMDPPGENSAGDISALSGLENLRVLVINNNDIVDISPLFNLEKLELLDLHGNSISDLSPLARLKKLKQLDLSLYNKNGHFSDISPLENLVMLEKLNLNSVGLDNISHLAGLDKLKVLDLNFNRIEDISPLEGLNELRLLALYDNSITEISALQGMVRLQFLDLENNKVSDISPLQGLDALKGLSLQADALVIDTAEGRLSLKEMGLEPELDDGNSFYCLVVRRFEEHMLALDISWANLVEVIEQVEGITPLDTCRNMITLKQLEGVSSPWGTQLGRETYLSTAFQPHLEFAPPPVCWGCD